MYPYIQAAPGAEITVTLANGVTITGAVADVLTDDDGAVRVLSMHEMADRPDPLHIRGDLIILWRFGAPVRQSPSALQVPVLQVPNGRQVG